ncbi:CDP-glycerol glycerophosphotransferase, partial [Micromonospora aurantiaca]
MRGDLVRKLLARGLTTGLAVLAFLVVALTGATGWGLALAVAGGPLPAGAPVTVAHAGHVDGGFPVTALIPVA